MLEELQKEQPSALIELVMRMQEALEEMRQEVGRLQRRVAELEEQNRPPSAPFRRAERERVKEPGKSGRKPGHPGACRATPDHIDEEIEVGLWACPHSGGAVEDVEPLIQYLEELPVLRACEQTEDLSRALCAVWKNRAQHPPPADERGRRRCRRAARGSRRGRGCPIKARNRTDAAQELPGSGVALRAAHNSRGPGASLSTRGPKTPSRLRAAWPGDGRLSGGSHRRNELVVCRASKLVGLCQGGENPATLYRVVAHRDRSTFHETIPADFSGVLVSDCLSVYDGATALQHKCYAHHLRAWRRARENLNPKQDTGWLTQVRALLDAAIKLRRCPDLSVEHREQSRRGLQLAAQALLAQPRADPAEESLRARLWKQRDHLLVFLDHPGVDPTNNLAERQLRPAVIARKLSCGNKTLPALRLGKSLPLSPSPAPSAPAASSTS